MHTPSVHRWLSLMLCSLLLLQALWVVTDAHGLMDDHTVSADAHHVDMLHEHGFITSHQHETDNDTSLFEAESVQHCCHANSMSAVPLLIINPLAKVLFTAQHFVFPPNLYHAPLQNQLYRPPIA